MGIMMSRRIATIIVVVGLILTVAAPVAADRDDNGHDVDQRPVEQIVQGGPAGEQNGKVVNQDGRARNDQTVGQGTCAATFHALADLEVDRGSIVGGPYDGAPVVVVSEYGHGLPLGTQTAIPTNDARYAIGPSGGLGREILPLPALVQIALVQQVPASATFTANPSDLILPVSPAMIALDSCQSTGTAP
jgi:hypothetical protein